MIDYPSHFADCSVLGCLEWSAENRRKRGRLVIMMGREDRAAKASPLTYVRYQELDSSCGEVSSPRTARVGLRLRAGVGLSSAVRYVVVGGGFGISPFSFSTKNP